MSDLGASYGHSPDPPNHSESVADIPSPVPSLSPASAAVAAPSRLLPKYVRKAALLAISLVLFALSIAWMKQGAHGIAPLFHRHFAVDSTANSLGFGWLFAYVVMSGSPVAAASLAFLDAGVVSEFGAYAMISGSRLGASFIVLLIGFIYILRGRAQRTSLTMGLLSLMITASIYLPGLALGYLLLRTNSMHLIRWESGILVTSLFDAIFDPIINLTTQFLPNWVVFALGVGFLMSSFSLFDRALPQVHLQESSFAAMARVLYRPIVTFALGLAVTALSMSVAISLSILVPLSARGYVRRENVIPYIMGANISTLIDTLLVALLLGNPIAFTVVVTQMAVATAIALAILLTFFRDYERWMLEIEARILHNNRNLTLFVLVIFAIPLLLFFA